MTRVKKSGYTFGWGTSVKLFASLLKVYSKRNNFREDTFQKFHSVQACKYYVTKALQLTSREIALTVTDLLCWLNIIICSSFARKCCAACFCLCWVSYIFMSDSCRFVWYWPWSRSISPEPSFSDFNIRRTLIYCGVNEIRTCSKRFNMTYNLFCD